MGVKDTSDCIVYKKKMFHVKHLSLNNVLMFHVKHMKTLLFTATHRIRTRRLFEAPVLRLAALRLHVVG